jgi:hypothetical protein
MGCQRSVSRHDTAGSSSIPKKTADRPALFAGFTEIENGRDKNAAICLPARSHSARFDGKGPYFKPDRLLKFYKEKHDV